jgi:RimJ/RimL family protein N-acetyltransferase
MDGDVFRLRPVEMEDAAFIVELGADRNRSRYLHRDATDLEAQRRWLGSYFERPGDYYFLIENRGTGEREGTAGIYNLDRIFAEWGRWIVLEGSRAAVESARLIYRVGFDVLALESIYCRTVVEDISTVRFHQSFGLERTRTLPRYFELDGRFLDAVEMRLTRPQWDSIRARADGKAARPEQHMEAAT